MRDTVLLLAPMSLAVLLASGVVLQTAIGSIKSAAHAIERPKEVSIITLAHLAKRSSRRKPDQKCRLPLPARPKG
jgi:acyl CoA:acetate/3-ketoacid CoA transferase beta subunit